MCYPLKTLPKQATELAREWGRGRARELGPGWAPTAMA